MTSCESKADEEYKAHMLQFPTSEAATCKQRKKWKDIVNINFNEGL
jgi:hypothetical protein